MEGFKYVILCVDDERISLIARTRVLEKAGYRVLPVNSATEALQMLAIRSADIDLVLTDLLMPGMNGALLAQAIKMRWPKLPVLLFSGISDLPPEASFADMFLSKLDGPVVLCEKIVELLKRFHNAFS